MTLRQDNERKDVVRGRQNLRLQMGLGYRPVRGGLALSGVSLARIAAGDMHMAQVSSPSQPTQTPGTTGQSPARVRPLNPSRRHPPATPAPEPARPDADAKSPAPPRHCARAGGKNAPPNQHQITSRVAHADVTCVITL